MKTLIILFFLPIMIYSQKTNSAVKEQPYTILILMNATPEWLSLTRNERSIFFENEVTPIFEKVGNSVKVKLCDSEYFHAQVSDFMILETTNLDDYKYLIEKLRDTKVYGIPYFIIKDIIIGQQNLFESFNETFKTEI